MGEFGIGQSVPREEDPYLVRGAGRYVDDVTVTGQLRGYVLRSPHAHARIAAIDVGGRQAMPGVQLVLTGNDPSHHARSALQRPLMPRKRRDGSPARPRAAARARARHRALRRRSGRVRGGRDAATRPRMRPRRSRSTTRRCRRSPASRTRSSPARPAVWHETIPDNIAFCTRSATRPRPNARSPGAAHVVKHRMVINRITTNSMEPRGCLAEYDHARRPLHLARAPCRARTRSAARLRAKCSKCRKPRCASFPRMSAAASA